MIVASLIVASLIAAVIVIPGVFAVCQWVMGCDCTDCTDCGKD